MARTKQSMRKTSRGQAPRMNPTKRLRPKQEDSDDPTDEGSPNPMEPRVEEMEDFEGYLSSPIQLTIGGSSPASSPQNTRQPQKKKVRLAVNDAIIIKKVQNGSYTVRKRKAAAENSLGYLEKLVFQDIAENGLRYDSVRGSREMHSSLKKILDALEREKLIKEDGDEYQAA